MWLFKKSLKSSQPIMYLRVSVLMTVLNVTICWRKWKICLRGFESLKVGWRCDSDRQEWVNYVLIVCPYLLTAVADPGFSRGGGANSKISYYLANFFPKTAWNWKNLDPGGTRPWRPPLDPPMNCSQGLKSISLTGCQCAMIEAKQRNPYSLNDETEISDLSLKHFWNNRLC